MKPSAEYLPKDKTQSFRYKHFKQNSFEFILHHHYEYELTLIKKGRGRRYVGDNISEFTDGDLIFVGPNLPHTWYGTKKGETIVVQFKEDFLGTDCLLRPEMRSLRLLFNNSTYGISFENDIAKKIGKKFVELEKSAPLKKIIVLLEILEILASTNKYKKIVKKQYTTNIDNSGANRISTICNYVHGNYAKEISLNEISNIASMTPNSFCRFFKKHTGKSFTNYVTDLRIGTASILLIETDFTISQICHKSGFRNLSNFNRKFMKLKNITPRDFRKEFNKFNHE